MYVFNYNVKCSVKRLGIICGDSFLTCFLLYLDIETGFRYFVQNIYIFNIYIILSTIKFIKIILYY